MSAMFLKSKPYRDMGVGLAFASVALVLIVLKSAASEHPCRNLLIASGSPLEGATSSLFKIVDGQRRFALDGLLVPGSEIALPTSEVFVLHTATNKQDRYRRIGVQAFLTNGEWLQGSLLERGEAFQFGLNQSVGCIAAMKRAEEEARKAKLGFWSTDPPVFEAKNTDALLQQAGKFAIISGKVRSVGDRRRRLYLNFGSNWSEDLTVVVVKTGSGAYRGDVAVLQQLEGKRIEIRGIVEDAQGPLIRLIDEAQIDILDR